MRATIPSISAQEARVAALSQRLSFTRGYGVTRAALEAAKRAPRLNPKYDLVANLAREIQILEPDIDLGT